jgi:hypothetical protein
MNEKGLPPSGLFCRPEALAEGSPREASARTQAKDPSALARLGTTPRDAVPNEVRRDAVPSEARDASISRGRTG